jgi:hypothetical protein
MSRTEALPPIAESTPRAEPGCSDPLPLLIQVPLVAPVRPLLRSQQHAPVMLRTMGPRRVKRRLRRKVRLAGLALLGFLPLPLALALTPGTSNRPPCPASSRVSSILTSSENGDKPTRAREARRWISPSETSSPPPVLLSIEPIGTTVDSETETSVVFPGYLLPDDSHEELAHEGS